MTVSELTSAVRGSLESRFGSVWIEGEISNFRAHSSGHWYFTLKDEGGTMKDEVKAVSPLQPSEDACLMPLLPL